MAKTQDIKRRIRSIRNTMQLTKAMKMVAAAKLRRAQERIIQARPYAHKIRELLDSLAARADAEQHPLLGERQPKKQELLIVTGDRGLCGAFNTNIARLGEELARRHADRELTISAIGKKGRDYFAHRGYNVRESWVDYTRAVDFGLAVTIGDQMIQRYIDGEVDAVHLIYNEFKSAIQSRPVVQQLLPVKGQQAEPGDEAEEYIYEPGAEEILTTLLPYSVKVAVYHGMLESVAAEHAARMTAMDSATNNAGELIDSLTLTMNRVRQAAITTDIIEVVSGAEALG